MPYQIYKLIHFFGLITVVLALSGAAFHALRGGTRFDHPHRRTLAIAHGAGLFLVLLGGFGMLARLDVMHGALPFWVYLKLGVWIIAGTAIVLAYRARGARAVIALLPLLVTVGAAIALYKPRL
jgi:hypothetical protein